LKAPVKVKAILTEPGQGASESKMEDLSQEPPRAFIRARPIRVAYLLEETQHSHLMLDGIFAESLAHWGGRYSLICPCHEGYPHGNYLPWLRVFDPDII
jgi:hypothetical protein